MPNLIQALATLKSRLDTINGTPMTENREGLANKEQSTQIFINRALVPKDLVFDDDFASSKESDDYSRHVLQAVWNIANTSSKGYLSAVWNRSTIVEAFSYLDESWVPKIIDQRTYAVGKALQLFLSDAITDEGLEDVPTAGGVRDGVRSTLDNLQFILNQRLAVYEAHTPEKLEEIGRLKQLRDERLALWNAEKQSFHNKIKSINILNNWKILAEDLNSDSARWERALATLEESVACYNQAATEFTDFCRQWKEENLRTNLPDTAVMSNYILYHTSKDMDPIETVRELARVYNTSPYDVWNQPIGDQLKKASLLTAENIGGHVIASADMQKDLLQAKIDDSKSLGDFERRLEDALLGAPDFVTSDAFTSMISKLKTFLSDDIGFYEGAIHDLEQHQIELLKYKPLIDAYLNDFEKNNPLPVIKETTNKPAFDKAFNLAQQKLKGKAQATEQQIGTIKKLLLQSYDKMHHLTDELAKQSEQGRKEQLKVATLRVSETHIKMNSGSRQKVVDAQTDLDAFVKDQYRPSVKALKVNFYLKISPLNKKIADTQLQINTANDTLSALALQVKQRKEFLTGARLALVGFKQVLDKHTGLYIPAAQIPSDKLKQYLECNQHTTSYLDGMYATEKAANAWYGVNRAYISNLYSYYTTFLGPSEFDYDLESVAEYITDKIALIDRELLVDPTSEVGSPAPGPYLLGAENLWHLQKEQQRVTTERKDLIASKEADEASVTNLTAEKTKRLARWDARKTEKEQVLVLATLEHQFNEMDHNQALIALHSYEFEYRVSDIEKEQKNLESLLRAVEAMSVDDALVHLESMEETIAAARVAKMMELNASKEYTGTQLQKLIGDLISTQRTDLEKLRVIEQSAIKKPAELTENIDKLAADFAELDKKKTRLDSDLETLKRANKENTQALTNKKLELVALKKLAHLETALKNKYPAMMEGGFLMADDRAERQQLIKEIDQFILTEFGVLDEFKDHFSAAVNKKHGEVTLMCQVLEDQLTILRLDRVSEDLDLLIQRSHMNSRDNGKGLLADIRKFKIREAAYIRTTDSLNEQIQEKFSLISEKMSKLESIENTLGAQLVESVIEDDEEQVSPDVVPPVIVLPSKTLSEKYFGSSSEQGIFDDYLIERAKQFWFKDLFRSFAALTFGCFGYKSDAQERSEYIAELKTAFDNYQREGEDYADALFDTIDYGQKQFSPRAMMGSEYNKSLHSLLEKFKHDVTEQRVLVDVPDQLAANNY